MRPSSSRRAQYVRSGEIRGLCGYSSMRLILVTQDFPPAVGGIQTYSKALADRFGEHVERFGVLAPYQRGCRKLDATLPYPVYRIPVPADAMRYWLFPFLSMACIRGGYRVAFLAQWYSGAATAIAKRLGLLKRVYSAAHGQELLRVPAEGRLVGRTYVRHRQRVLATIDGFFPVSRYTGSLLAELRVPPSNIHVVYNGTDVERFALTQAEREKLPQWRRFHGIPNGPLLLTVARLVRRKGIDTVLRALPAITSSVLDVQYAIVGSGPDRDRLQALCTALGVQDRVFFLGRLTEQDVVMAYNACNVFVMPARFEHPSVEGFGLVFREANACGKPVVGARTGGVPDAVQHGRTGLLIEPDEVDALGESVLKLLKNPAYAATLGERGRQVVERSGTWRHAAAQMLSVL